MEEIMVYEKICCLDILSVVKRNVFNDNTR